MSPAKKTNDSIRIAGRVIQSIRKERQLSIQDLQQLLNVSAQWLYYLETGARRARYERSRRLRQPSVELLIRLGAMADSAKDRRQIAKLLKERLSEPAAAPVFAGGDPVTPSRSIDTFSKEVLLQWVKERGFSYFIDELIGIERRMQERGEQQPPACTCSHNGQRATGITADGKYCTCPLGRDLMIVETRKPQPLKQRSAAL
jgi:transcriptional regulator with XRE-family HTH domain